MAKHRRGKKENMSAYFREVFKEKPHWLHQKSNVELLARYRSDHDMPATADVDQSVKQTMANVKSILRNGSGGKAKAAPKRMGSGPYHVPPALGKVNLETLEDLIDECLVSAKSIDREGLKSVITSLRSARNAVVWKLGE